MRSTGRAAESTSPSPNTRCAAPALAAPDSGAATSGVLPLSAESDGSEVIAGGVLSIEPDCDGAVFGRLTLWRDRGRVAERTGAMDGAGDAGAAIALGASSCSTIRVTGIGGFCTGTARIRGSALAAISKTRPFRARERTTASIAGRRAERSPSEGMRNGKATGASGSEVNREAHADVPVVAGREVPIQDARRRLPRETGGVVELCACITLIGQVLDREARLEPSPAVAQ